MIGAQQSKHKPAPLHGERKAGNANRQLGAGEPHTPCRLGGQRRRALRLAHPDLKVLAIQVCKEEPPTLHAPTSLERQTEAALCHPRGSGRSGNCPPPGLRHKANTRQSVLARPANYRMARRSRSSWPNWAKCVALNMVAISRPHMLESAGGLARTPPPTSMSTAGPRSHTI